MIQDILVIGGGINGAAIAADAAGRGLKATLCEQDDLASHTSSYSSKLIHGGLRYLEQYQFKLVRESLTEREVLLKTAPHLVHPLEIVLPQYQNSRPAWILRIGLWLYDHLGIKHSLQKTRQYRCKTPGKNNPLISKITKAYSYSDCQTDDARFVIANALRAQQKGATILTRHKVIKTQRLKTQWNVTVLNQNTGETHTIKAKCLINAAGPWVDTIQHQTLKTLSPYSIKLVQGSHLVFDKLYEGNQAYILQNADKRIIFVIPYLDDFTLVGTTDMSFEGDPAKVAMSQAEKTYLCDIVNQYFHTPIKPADAKWCFSGVRPLVFESNKNASTLSRDYKLDLHHEAGKAPLLSIFGGKLTTHRHLAETALNLLHPVFPNMTGPWTSRETIPGSGFTFDLDKNTPIKSRLHSGPAVFKAFTAQLAHDFPWLPEPMQKRFAKAYGSRTYELLKNCKSLKDLRQHFGGTLYQCEVQFLIDTEWAQTCEDILWRRTKQGLYLTPAEVEKLTQWLKMQTL